MKELTKYQNIQYFIVFVHKYQHFIIGIFEMIELNGIQLRTEDNIIENNSPLSLKPLKFIEKKIKINCMYIHNKTLYLGTNNSKVYIYTINELQLENQTLINSHCSCVSEIIASDNFFVIIPQQRQSTDISIWTTQNNKFYMSLLGHKAQIVKPIFLKSEQNFLATASWDGTILIWSLRSESYDKKHNDQSPIFCIEEISRDLICFGGENCFLTFWNWRKDQITNRFFGHAGSVTSIYSFLPYILTCGGDNKFKFWLVDSEHYMSEMEVQENQSYNIKVIKEEKNNYNSSVYIVGLSQNIGLLIDKNGKTFKTSLSRGLELISNEVRYYENITGLARFNNKLFITTDQSTIKIYQIQQKHQIKQQVSIDLH